MNRIQKLVGEAKVALGPSATLYSRPSQGLRSLAVVHLGDVIEWKLTLGDLSVAIGTIALAAVTFWLALQTKREVGLTTDSIEAQDMPYVIAIPQDEDVWIMPWGRSEKQSSLIARLTNVGKGPAIVQDVQLIVQGRDLMTAAGGGMPIAAGAYESLWLDIEGDPPVGAHDGCLKIYYTHASGSEWMTKSTAIVDENEGVLCRDFDRMKPDGGRRPYAA